LIRRTFRSPQGPSLVIALIALLAAAIIISARLVFSRLGNTEPYVDQLSKIAAAGLHVLTFTAAIGIAAMALLESIKRLFPLRGYFHRAQLRRMLGDESMAAISFLLTPSPQAMGLAGTKIPIPVPPLKDPLLPHRALDPLTWFDIPLEQLVAQIGTLAEQELDLLLSARGSATTGDVKGALIEGLIGAPIATLLSPQLSDEELGNVAANVRAQVEISLDALQTVIGGRWRRSVRLASCIIGTGLAFGVVLFSTASYALAAAILLTSFFLGGFFSWVSRDIVAGIERWRA
jgi:hypothetical protein